MDRFAKIPAKICTHNKSMVKALAVYFALKQLNWRGYFLQYRSQINQIAQDLNISPNNLRAKLKILIDQGAAIPDGKNLQLCSYKKLWDILEITNPRFYKIADIDAKKIEEFIYFLPIRENLRHQEYAYTKKIIHYEFQQIDAQIKNNMIDPLTIAAILKRSRERAAFKDHNGENQLTDYGRKLQKFARFAATKLEGTLKNHLKTFYAKMAHSFEMPSIQPRTTLSSKRAGEIALNRSNPSTGYYLLNKLYASGLIEIRNVSVKADQSLNKQQNAARYMAWHELSTINSVIGKRRFLSNSVLISKNNLF